MKSLKYFGFAFLALLFVFIFQYFLIIQFTPKIAYVRSDKLLSEYIGMHEAKDEFTQKQRKWQSNIDSLKNDIAKYRESNEISKRILQQMEQNAALYIEKINTIAQEEDMKSTELVYQQINTFIEDYGKKKGYSMIFGSGTPGAILYGDEALDITDELLSSLNQNYNPNHEK